MIFKTPITRLSDESAGDPLVSMVTPFFNTADYLEECIKSVLSQTYTNWEYILVDNCSTDGSGYIAERYAATDPRIRLFHEVDFVGQTENYNRALRYISSGSKYCKIVQADDWIYPQCLEEMVAVAESGKNVGLVSSYTLYGDFLCHDGLPIASGPVYSGRYVAGIQLLGTVLFGSPTGVLYSSDIVRARVQFFSTTTPYFEDTDVCYEILRNHDFGFVPQVLSFTRRDNDSIWKKLDPYGPQVLSDVMFIHLYGSEFLAADKFISRKRATEDCFYNLLVKGYMRRFRKEFWMFHARGLAAVGQKISYRRVALNAFLLVVSMLANPGKSIKAIWRRVRLLVNKTAALGCL